MVKTRSTLIMDADLWKRFKMIAILNEMEVSELVEQALREKLERMKQLEQYPEYKDVKDLHVQSRSHEKSQQPQQQSQTRRQSPNAASVQQSDENYPIIITSGKDEYLLNLIIPELTFPTTKQKIRQALLNDMEHIKQETHPSQQDSVRKILYIMNRNLDIILTLLSWNKTYKDVGQIEETIVKSPKEKLSMLHIKPEGKLIGCKISYGLDILRREMGMELISEKDR